MKFIRIVIPFVLFFIIGTLALSASFFNSEPFIKDGYLSIGRLSLFCIGVFIILINCFWAVVESASTK